MEGAEDVPEQSIIDASHITGKLTALGVVWNDEKIDAYITNTLSQVKTAEVTLRGMNDVTHPCDGTRNHCLRLFGR